MIRGSSGVSQLSILIVSCDRYADIWPAFFTLFWRYWPDCPYPVLLGANRQAYCNDRVATVLTGDDPSWGESTRRMVQQVESTHVLVMLEDFFLLKPVDADQVERCLSCLCSLDGGYLRLKPFPKPDRRVKGCPMIGEIDRGAPYRSALQAAIWRRDTLLRLLEDGESAWDMELFGSRRSDFLQAGFYSTWQSILVYEAGVTRGKWLPWAVKLCDREGIKVDLDMRPVMSAKEYRRQRGRRLLLDMFNRIPWRRRRPIGDLLRRVGLLPPRREGFA